MTSPISKAEHNINGTCKKLKKGLWTLKVMKRCTCCERYFQNGKVLMVNGLPVVDHIYCRTCFLEFFKIYTKLLHYQE